MSKVKIYLIIYFVAAFFIVISEPEELFLELVVFGVLLAFFISTFGSFHFLDRLEYIGFGASGETLGKIKSISIMQVSYGHYHSVLVEYAGIEREIYWVYGDFMVHFKVGDEVVLEYNKKNIYRSRINIEKSLKHKRNLVKKWGSKLQVDSIIKQPMMGFYRVKGKIISDDYSGRDVSIVTLLDSDKAETMQPGSVVDCNVSEFDGELVVSFS